MPSISNSIKSISNIPGPRKLYIKTGLPDNYVDENFLQKLNRNANVRPRTFWEMFFASGPIVQQLSVTLSFVAVFIFVLEDRISGEELSILSNIITVVVYAFWVIYMRSEISHHRQKSPCSEAGVRQRGRETILQGLIFTLLLMLMSPVLKTLTEDTSSDTIWAVSSGLLLLGWMVHDYSREDGSRPLYRYCSPLSLNFSMLAAIALASRLPTTTHVFGLLSLAVNVFAFFPLFRRIIDRMAGSKGSLLCFSGIIALCLVLWSFVYRPAALIYAAAVIFISVISPLWLLRLQRYKK
jgi:phosphatidylinositol glycan class C protein